MVFGGLSEPTFNPSESRQLRGVHASVARKPEAQLLQRLHLLPQVQQSSPHGKAGPFRDVPQGSSRRASLPTGDRRPRRLPDHSEPPRRIVPGAPCPPMRYGQSRDVADLGEHALLAGIRGLVPASPPPRSSESGTTRRWSHRRATLMVLTTDASSKACTSIRGCRRGTTSAAAAAVNLSDLAAMGGTPGIPAVFARPAPATQVAAVEADPRPGRGGWRRRRAFWSAATSPAARDRWSWTSRRSARRGRGGRVTRGGGRSATSCM